MNKIKITAVAAGILLLAGCGCQKQAGQNETVGVSAPKTEEKSAVSDVISSIKDAMASGKAMECTYSMKDENGTDMVYKTYVKGENYKTDFTAAGISQHMIFDGEAMYSWQEGQKQGTKMTVACSEELAQNTPETPDSANQVPDPTGEETFDDAFNMKCENASSADFSVPSDITFADQCEMLKNLMKNIPSGTNIPNMPSNIPQLP